MENAHNYQLASSVLLLVGKRSFSRRDPRLDHRIADFADQAVPR